MNSAFIFFFTCTVIYIDKHLHPPPLRLCRSAAPPGPLPLPLLPPAPPTAAPGRRVQGGGDRARGLAGRVLPAAEGAVRRR